MIPCGILLSGVRASEDEKKLNFLLIVTDDHGAEAACYGTRGIKTPHMDRLAADGMLFWEAFSTSSSCSPARSSLLTGMWPHSNGHWRNTHAPHVTCPEVEFTTQSSYREREKVGVHEDLPTLVEILHQHGYETGITQKLHLSPPWKYAFKHRRRGRPGEAAARIIADCGDKPFFIQVNIDDTHRVWNVEKFRENELSPVDPDAIEIPGDLPDTPRMRQEYCQYLYAVESADYHIGQVLKELEKSGKADTTVVICTGDQGPAFQRGKATAYDRGVRTVFLVRGPGTGQGLQSNALVSHADVVPTILESAGIRIPKSVQGRSLVPLLQGDTSKSWRKYVFSEHNSHGPNLENEYYPTRGVYDGRMHYLRNLTPQRRADKPLEAYLGPEQGRKPMPWIVADCIPYGVYAGKTDCLQATVAARKEFPLQYELLQQTINRPAEELYDLHSDPFELQNVAADPRYAPHLKELRKALDQWMEETNDPGADLKEVPRRTARDRSDL